MISISAKNKYIYILSFISRKKNGHLTIIFNFVTSNTRESANELKENNNNLSLYIRKNTDSIKLEAHKKLMTSQVNYI